MEQLIRRSAALHLDHIAGSGDPFERGSARPLDFGHWIAHKLEPMSGFEVGHGDAVAIGLAADVIYCTRVGLLKEEASERGTLPITGTGFRNLSSLCSTPRIKMMVLSFLTVWKNFVNTLEASSPSL